MDIIIHIICAVVTACSFALFAGSQNAQRKIAEKFRKRLDESFYELYEADRENLKLRQEKEKAVKACRVYRENINRLYGNLINLNDTYESNEENLKKAIEQVIFLTGQLEAYRKIYGDTWAETE